MSITKKIASCAVAAVCTLSLAACGEDTAWVVSCNGEQLRAGIYLFYQMDNATVALSANNADKDVKLKDVVIDGVAFDDYVQSTTFASVKEHYAIEQEFEKLGIELTKDQTEAAQWMIDYYNGYYEEYLIELGIGQESLEEVMFNSSKRDAVFNEYYKVGGIKGTTQEEVDEFFADNFIRFKVIELDLKDDEGNLLADADKQTVRDEAQEIIDQYNDGTSFDDLIAEREEAEETEETEDTIEETTEEATDAEAEDTAEEVDEYENEFVVDLENSTFSDEFAAAYKEKSVGDCFMIEEDEVIFVLEKLDITQRKDSLEEYTEDIIVELKTEEFDALVAQWAAEVTLEKNEKALKRYLPSKQAY